MNASGLVYNTDLHHLDHIAPLCSLLQIPLVYSDEIVEKCLSYYPNLKAVHCDPIAIHENLIANYSTVFTCLPRPYFESLFGIQQILQKKNVKSIWVPHGNSDKGLLAPLMEGLMGEPYALLYGEKMIDFLKNKNVFSSLGHTHVIGNYRYQYYKLHKKFYDALSQKILNFKKKQTTILYAPTWQDSEKSSSFPYALSYFLENIPTKYNLIIKPHPHLKKQYPELFQSIKEKANVLLMECFSPIYPLLAATDVYVGDASSIGYDFLYFDRPMLFLNVHKQSLPIFQNGKTLSLPRFSFLFDEIEEILTKDAYHEIRKKTYDYTFGTYQPFVL